MREILFRGKAKWNNLATYGSYVKENGKHYIVSNSGRYYGIYPETLEEYSGYKDIKESRIFENDTVEMESMAPGSPEITGKVIFGEGCWWVDDGERAETLFQEISIIKIIKRSFDE